MKTGDLLLVRRKFNWKRPISYLSTSIRWFTDFYFNHMEVIVVIDGVIYTVGAHFLGVKMQRFDEYTSDKDLEILHVKYKELAFNRIFDTVNNRYDKMALLFHHPIYQLTRKWNNYWNGKDEGVWLGKTGEEAKEALVCSEVVAWVHELPKFWLMSTREVMKEIDFKLFLKYKR